MTLYAIFGGIWLSILFSSTVMPATVRVIQVTVSRDWIAGMATAFGVALGQVPWCLLASAILFNFAPFWISNDLPLRAATVLFLVWMAYRTSRARKVTSLNLQLGPSMGPLFWQSLSRSFSMPWRFPLWSSIIISVGIHLKGPGWWLAVVFTAGSLIGQFLWYGHFVVVAALFGRRVPEYISLRSMNKMRFLATIVLCGLALIILAPLAFLPS